MSFCILYDVVLESHSVQYSSSGRGGLLAYCDLTSFKLSLQQTFHFDTDVIFSLTDIILKIK